MDREQAGRCAEAWAVAVTEGKAAAAACQPVPMLVTEHEDQLDDASPVKQAWLVCDGTCGFAWITVKPGNSRFANWLKEHGLARRAYGGGVSVWISEFGQSLQIKEAYAHAAAKSLRETLGIRAYAGSRMD